MKDLIVATGLLCASDIKKIENGYSIVLMGGVLQRQATQSKSVWTDQQPVYFTVIFPSAWGPFLEQMRNSRTSKSLKGGWVDIVGNVSFSVNPENLAVSINIEPFSFDFASNERHNIDDDSCNESLFKYHGGIISFNIFRLRIFSDRTIETIRQNQMNKTPVPNWLNFDAAHDIVKETEKSSPQIRYHLIFGQKTVKQADRCLIGNSHIDVTTGLTSISASKNKAGDQIFINVYMTVEKFQISPSITQAEKAQN